MKKQFTDEKWLSLIGTERNDCNIYGYFLMVKQSMVSGAQLILEYFE